MQWGKNQESLRGFCSYHKRSFNFRLINTIEAADLSVVASSEGKEGSHLHPTEKWVPGPFKRDGVIGVISSRPQVLRAQAVKEVAHGEGGGVIPRVAGVGDVGAGDGIL